MAVGDWLGVRLVRQPHVHTAGGQGTAGASGAHEDELGSAQASRHLRQPLG